MSLAKQMLCLYTVIMHMFFCVAVLLSSSAIDIKDLKILEIRNGRQGSRLTQVGVVDLGPSSAGSQEQGSGGGSGAPDSSASVPVPHKTELTLLEERSSLPQPQCSKSYGERRSEAAGQAKGPQQRRNSCEYCSVLVDCRQSLLQVPDIPNTVFSDQVFGGK